MAVLILAEIDDGKLSASVLPAVTAAGMLGGELHLLVAGHVIGEVAKEAATISGIAKVIHSDAAYLADRLAEDVVPLAARLEGYSHYVVAATSWGKDVMPRLCGLLDVQQASEVIAIVSPDTYQRPIYAGNAIEAVQSAGPRHALTIRPSAFAAAGREGSAVVESGPVGSESGLSRFIGAERTKSERPELAGAKIVVSGGRGLGSKENFRLLESVADKLGAALGASRAAVDAGYVPNDYQVGQTGKVVAPELYLAVGISGAIQHLAGMKDSKVIVAINKDENAPIFEIADYGLVGDLFDVLPKLEALL